MNDYQMSDNAHDRDHVMNDHDHDHDGKMVHREAQC